MVRRSGGSHMESILLFEEEGRGSAKSIRIDAISLKRHRIILVILIPAFPDYFLRIIRITNRVGKIELI